MLKISNLSKSFGSQLLFDDVSFQVNAGERLGLVGRNGHGKTTLFNMIMEEDYPDSGEISVPKNYSVGYLNQELTFTRDTILEEACRGLPPGQEEDTWKGEKILAGLGFSDGDMGRPAKEFSGGFQVRINLAQVLVSQPSLLLLDEPTNFLDIVAIRWLERYLTSWNGELMVISHDRQFLDCVSTHVLGIHRRKVRKIQGNSEKLFLQIESEEEIHEKTRHNEAKKRKQEELFISRFRAKARLAGMVQSRIKSLEKKTRLEKLENIKQLSFSFRWEPFSAKNLLGAHNLTFSYQPEQPPLIKGFNLHVGPRARIAIIGKNGKGKSTLLKLLAGKLTPATGSLSPHPILKTGYFEQSNTDLLDPRRTVEQEILASDPSHDRKRARDICGAMMFEGEQALKPIAVLSGGEKSRVSLAKLLVSPCHLLLLDEPTNHLDPESCEALMRAMQQFKGAVIIVTHNERFLTHISEQLVVFDKGTHRLVEGGYREFLKDIGWSTEEGLRTGGSPNRSEKPDRKEQRRLKAEIQQAKSRALKGYKKQISKLEKAITAMEADIHTSNQNLLQASTENDGKKITELSKKLHKLQTDVDYLYNDLDKETRDYESIEKEYDAKINRIN